MREMVSPSRRAISVDGLVNARDLGGLRRADGSTTPHGVFFRSENVDWVTQAGWEQVDALGIRTVVDLRQPGERARDTQNRPDWLTTINVDLDGLDNQDFWKDHWDNGLVGTALYFLPHLNAMPENSAAVLRALADAPAGGVLFHCMGGRDRTGQIAMLLLAAADVEPDEIVDDYLETVRLGDVRAASRQCQNAEPQLEKLCATLGTTTEGAFRQALTGLDLDTFFEASALDERTLAAIRTWRGAIA
ncbi:MAG TPA: tyrosine-protein phosphatase [Microbacteriaceae bacterium]|nr:tyrosine-protein phosphatase [Microbacteriaceae bacterium]